MLTTTEARRFWANVRPGLPAEYWQWQGSDNGQGYGRITINGRKWRAHRLAVLLSGRAIPDGFVVDHICRNRGCVNPAHLRVVTPTTNTLENSAHFTAKYIRRTHCVHGHEYTPENTYIRIRGARRCRVCKQCQVRHDANYYKRKKRQALERNQS